MIVKMTILRFLGSSDDKEKIDVARPEGQELKRPWRNPSRKDQDEANFLAPVKPMMSKFVLIGAMNLAPDQPALGVLHSPVYWTWRQKKQQKFYRRRLNRRSRQVSVGAVVQRLHFSGGFCDYIHRLNRRWFWERRSIDQVAVGAVTASCWENTLTG